MRKTLTALGVAISILASLAACDNDAKIVSENLSKAADMFEVNRRVVFVNGITGDYLLSIEGKCSLDHQRNQLEVTCKNGPDAFKKHFLGLSDNVTYVAEQLDNQAASAYHYRVVFKPQTIIPEIDLRGSGKEVIRNRH